MPQGLGSGNELNVPPCDCNWFACTVECQESALVEWACQHLRVGCDWTSHTRSLQHYQEDFVRAQKMKKALLQMLENKEQLSAADQAAVPPETPEEDLMQKLYGTLQQTGAARRPRPRPAQDDGEGATASEESNEAPTAEGVATTDEVGGERS